MLRDKCVSYFSEPMGIIKKHLLYLYFAPIQYLIQLKNSMKWKIKKLKIKNKENKWIEKQNKKKNKFRINKKLKSRFRVHRNAWKCALK